jgi:DNA-binding response OmpR family regulator
VPGSKFRRIPRADLIKFMRDNEIPTTLLEAGPKRILVVDDDQQIIDMFKDLLGKDQSIEVRTAGTGYEAGLLTESFRPHLIILDYLLPDINGNIVCKRLREREDFKSTKIIFVSGVVDPKEIELLKSAGADDFIRKPFDVASLIARIRQMLAA